MTVDCMCEVTSFPVRLAPWVVEVMVVVPRAMAPRGVCIDVHGHCMIQGPLS